MQGVLPHPGGWCTGKKKATVSLPTKHLNSLTFGDAPGHPEPHLPPPSFFSFSLSPLTPRTLSVQVAERTSAEGCSLSSPTHGQRSLELPPRATVPLAKGGKHLCIYVDFRGEKDIFILTFLFSPFFFLKSREQIKLCSMRNHAYHPISQCAADRLLPTDLPHPHQR